MVFSNVLRSQTEWQGTLFGNTQVMGGDARRRDLPTSERGSHEPKRYEAYDGDDERLANPLDVTESPGATPPEPEGRVGSPLRNVAEKGYGGEDATVTPTRHKVIEHYQLGLPTESSVVVKGCSVTPTMVRGDLVVRPSKMTVGEIRCRLESGGPRVAVSNRGDHDMRCSGGQFKISRAIAHSQL
jgi:hypothetical protein